MGRGKRQSSWRAVRGRAEVAETRPRPLLLLDVDGVVLADEGQRVELKSGSSARLAEGASGLKDIATSFECVWASAWGERANEEIGSLIGLDLAQFIDFKDAWKLAGRRGRTWKLRDVKAFAGERPLAWVDDELKADVRAWAEERERAGVPTLLVEVDSRYGLTGDQVQKLRAFAERCW